MGPLLNQITVQDLHDLRRERLEQDDCETTDRLLDEIEQELTARFIEEMREYTSHFSPTLDY